MNHIHWELASKDNLPPIRNKGDIMDGLVSVDCLVWPQAWFPVIGKYIPALDEWQLTGVHGEFKHSKMKIYFAIINNPFKPNL